MMDDRVRGWGGLMIGGMTAFISLTHQITQDMLACD